MKRLLVFVSVALLAIGCGKSNDLTTAEKQGGELKNGGYYNGGYYYPQPYAPTYTYKGQGKHYGYYPSYHYGYQGYYTPGYYHPGYQYPGYYQPQYAPVKKKYSDDEGGEGYVRNPGYDAAPPFVRHHIPKYIPSKKSKSTNTDDDNWYEERTPGYQGQGAGAGEGASDESIGDYYRRKYRGGW